MKFTIILLALLAAPIFAMADHQGSVSFNCASHQIAEFDLEGISFFPNQLAQQGYSVSVVNHVVNLNHGTQSIALGYLQTPGECHIGSGTYYGFISFTNANLAIGKHVEQLTGCFDVTSDGMYGIKQAITISLVSLDNGFSMQLQETYTQGYNSLEQCQADLKN